MAAVGDDLDRMGHVDGLRAVAVLAVVASHAAKYTIGLQSPWFHPLFEGTHGVDLFFVISGLCLSYPTLARLRRTGAARFSLSGFFAKRALRIYPPYWLAFVAAFVSTTALVRAGFQAPWPAIQSPASAIETVRQLFLVQNGHELVGSFWTLAVELRWYVLFPGLLWLWTRSKPAFAAVGVLSFAVYHLHWVHLLDFATLPAFMLGIVAADLTLRGPAMGGWALAAAALGGYLAVRYEPQHLAYVVTDQPWWQICAFFFVLAGCTWAPMKRALGWRPLVVIGLASYSIYLFHDPVMAWYGKYGGTSPAASAIGGVAIGLLAWIVFEHPYMRSRLRERALTAVRRWASNRPPAADAATPAHVEFAR